MQFEKRRVEGAAGALDVLVGGSGDPLVCLHAASGARINPATELLAQHRALYLPINPGVDGTPPVAGVDSVAALAGHIAQAIGTMFDGPVDLSGHSFGGWMACWLAALHPDRVRRLVLQCPAGLNPHTGEALEGDPATFLQRAFAHPEKRPPETKTPETVKANRDQAALYAGGITYDRALVDRLGRITSKTLILYGVKDGVIPPETPKILAEHIPDATLRYIDDAAHNIEIDQPEIFADAVLSFLSDD